MAANNPGNRKDPLPIFCFQVDSIRGEAFFKSVSGLKYETEVIPVREGGANDTTFMLPGAVKWGPITLKRGFTGSSKLLEWREEWLAGTGSRIPTGRIIQLDGTMLTKKAQWEFVRGWPSKWEVSEFDASKSELAIETLEITHEGIKFTPLG
ncbi:MAG TPA: phage tail protein [Kofleriaceae bacterium]